MRLTSLSLLAALAAVLSPFPAAAQYDLLPNLQPLPPVSPYLTTSFPDRVQLRFGALAWNNGMGPVEIRGGQVSSDGETQEVWQRVYRDDGGHTDYLAGTFIHHQAHGHIHFEDYALYTLAPIDVSVPAPGVSTKTSFCLLDTEKINGRLPGAPRKAVYTTCGSVRQGISVGWGDQYGPTLPGQSIDVTGFPEGTYRLAIEIDPYDGLLELDDNDNVAAVRVYLNPATLSIQVLGEDDPTTNVRIDSMVPAVMTKGQILEVTITGEGFDANLPVSFQGDSGSPRVSGVVFESGTTIRATVTAGKGGPSRTRTFDLHVGPAVLPGALTVLPNP